MTPRKFVIAVITTAVWWLLHDTHRLLAALLVLVGFVVMCLVDRPEWGNGGGFGGGGGGGWEPPQPPPGPTPGGGLQVEPALFVKDLMAIWTAVPAPREGSPVRGAALDKPAPERSTQ